MDYGQFKERSVNKYCFHIKNKWSVTSGYLLNMYTMRRVADNYTAEIIITVVVLVMILTSCGSTYSCPAYSNYKTNTNVVG